MLEEIFANVPVSHVIFHIKEIILNSRNFLTAVHEEMTDDCLRSERREGFVASGLC